MASNAKFQIDIYGNTVQFENSLKGIDSAMASLKGEATELRKQLKFDPSNVQNMTKLQNNYKQQLEQTRNKAESLKKELSTLDKSTPDGQKKFIQLSKSLQDSELKANYLEKDIKQLDSSIASGNFKVNIKTDDAESNISKVKSGFNGLKEIAVGAMREIGSSIINAIGNKFGDWIGGALDTQRSMIALKNTMRFKGNQDEFDGLSKRMSKLATDTNANTKDALGMATTFIGLGDSAKIAGDKTDALIRANQNFGGSSQSLAGVSMAYQQMSASQKVSAENINQMSDNNTALGASLKDTVMQMNPSLKQYGSFSDAVSKGKVSIQMLDDAMAKMAKGSGGGESNIGDSFDSLNETIEKSLLPALREIQPVITNILNDIIKSIPSIASMLGNVYKWIKKNWDWLSKILIVVGSLIAIWTIFSGVMSIVSTVMFTFGISMGVAFGWLTVIVLAIAAVVAIGILIAKNWKTIGQLAVSIWGGIKNFFAGLGTWFGQLWTGIMNVFKSVWQGMKNVITTIWNGIKAYFSTLIAFYTGIFNAILNVIKIAFSFVAGIASQAFNAIVQFFTPLGNVFKAIFDLVVAVFRLGWELILALGRGAWMGIQAVWNGLVGFFQPIFQAVANVVNGVFNAIRGYAQGAWNFIVSVFSVVAGWFSGIFNSVRNIVSGVFNAFAGFARSAWSGITGIFSAVGSWFSGAFNSIRGVVSGVFNAFGSIARSGYNAITGVFSGIGSFFSGIFNGVKDIVDKVLGGIADTINGITKTIGGITDKVKGLFKGSATVNVAREFADLKSRGLVQNSSSSSTANYKNTFNIQAGNQDTTALARAIKREFDLGRA
ncbi:tape measure protein [Lactococcus hircilactis]|uniref:Tape measure protein n=1 Tax=Lactococcus hircilactis TaxID=1494462 RepID=A0A7X1ZA18_9LACT|nr:tape measure protein [Lactococcus hircilactis]MQW40640.1 tape measure protein [Lactococcus hircilactis]